MPSVQRLLQQMPHWRTILPAGSHKVMSLIERCHTAALGYHQYRCSDAACGHIHTRYHSCRNRHCPACGASRSAQWMEERINELLPVKYFHVVFTLPHELGAIAMGNRKAMFNLLFDAASHCILTLCNDPKRLGAMPSITSVLHTWGQQLVFHPHVHCIVSGGGADKQNDWKPLKKGAGDFLFPYKVMEPIFKGYFLERLNKLIGAGEVKLPDTNWKKTESILRGKRWMIHAKKPFGNAAQIVEYLARYTQKVAISNHRIKKIDENNRVTFSYKDYADKGKQKFLTLNGEEFLRRFAQHILPKRFVRIRHYGIIGNNKRKQTVAKILEKMKLPLHAASVKMPPAIWMMSLHGIEPDRCPLCKKAKLILIKTRYPMRT